jgi:hypothetical protein
MNKEVFFSSKNTTFLIENVVTRLFDKYDLSIQEFVRGNANKYKQVVVEVQHYIWSRAEPPSQFNQQFVSQLNQLAIRQLELYIENDISQFQIVLSPPPHQSEPPLRPTLVHIEHLFSSRAEIDGGRYTFRIPRIQDKIIKSIEMRSVELECNLYNINHANNKFEILEGEPSSSLQVNIPFGYYNLRQLLECITEICNKHSPNGVTYNVYLHPLKHKTYFTCNASCKIVFGVEDGLRNMLGFSNSEYLVANVCKSELHPSTNIFDTLYLRLFVNGKEVKRVCSGDGAYFQMLKIPYEEYFGKVYSQITKPQISLDVFDFQEDISFNDISIEICNPLETKINQVANFNVVCDLEYED